MSDRTPGTVLGDGPLRLADLVDVARHRRRVALSPEARSRVASGRAVIERVLESGAAVYGVTTGFGSQSHVPVSPDVRSTMQRRILRSHAAGAGAPFPDEVVRTVLLLRANMLSKGHSGVRPIVVDHLLSLLNNDMCPVVPEQGSVGASGDLAPLAHLSLALIGEGEIRTSDGVRPAKDALAAARMEPLVLEAKEASSLTNGTEVTLALAALGVADTDLLLNAAEVAAAMSFTAMRGHLQAYDERLHRLRPHPGQLATAERLRMLVEPTRGTPEARRPIHDIYTLRCVPQVLGPVWEALGHVRKTVEIEMDSVTDNPVCFADDGAVLSGGNFHGHPLALACDYLRLSVASIGTFAERRIASLLDSRSSGLPELLSPDPGANSGFLLTQYVAASLANENKTLAHPASVDSITTAGGAEDYNSMSATSARHLRMVIANTYRIVAMELMCAAQGIDLAKHDSPRAVAAAHSVIRTEVPFLASDDAVVSDLVASVERLVRDGALRRAVGLPSTNSGYPQA